MSEAAYSFAKERIGELECGVIRPTDPSQPVNALAVFSHGYGANGDDLVGLAPELLQIAPIEGAVLVFPEGPISLDDEGMPGGKAWWKLSIQRLLSAIDNGQYELIREEVPEGIDEARGMLVEAINILLERCSLDSNKLMLAGFSQGGMLTMDAALIGIEHKTLGEEPAAVVNLVQGQTATEAELQEWVRARLANFKVPVKVLFSAESLPRNANGKILKRDLKSLF